MNWLEKVKELKKQRTNNIFIDARFRENLWEADEIAELKQQFPFLPEMYTKFIEEFDSCGIAFAVFFGSRKSKIISVQKQIEEHKELLKNDYFPFGKYPDGSIFCLTKRARFYGGISTIMTLKNPNLLPIPLMSLWTNAY